MISMYYLLREQLAIFCALCVQVVYVPSRELVCRKVAGIWKRKDTIKITFALYVPRDSTRNLSKKKR